MSVFFLVVACLLCFAGVLVLSSLSKYDTMSLAKQKMVIIVSCFVLGICSSYFADTTGNVNIDVKESISMK